MAKLDGDERIIEAAQAHEDAHGEPLEGMAMRVGDLESVIYAAWEIMSPKQREKLMNTEEVKSVLEWLEE